MPKNPLDVLEAKLQRSLSAGAFDTGRYVWWQGPQEACKLRDLAKGPDPYHMLDRDGVIKKMGDKRFRRLDCVQLPKSGRDKFGPNQFDLDIGVKLKSRPGIGDAGNSRPTSWKTNPDPYQVMENTTMIKLVEKNTNQMVVFPRLTRKNSSRGSYPCLFTKDYTRLGSCSPARKGN
jgi:hypothetical protein